MSKTLKTAQEVRSLVEPFVRSRQPDHYQLVLLEPYFSSAMDAWMVPIDVDRDGVSATDFSRRLAELEEEIIESTGHDLVVHASSVTSHPQKN